MNKVLTGFCGIVLVLREGTYHRQTWGKPSHERCPQVVAGAECCSCHEGHEPWVNNTYVHAPVVLEPTRRSEETPAPAPRKPAFAPAKPTTKPNAAVADMAEALREMEDDDAE